MTIVIFDKIVYRFAKMNQEKRPYGFVVLSVSDTVGRQKHSLKKSYASQMGRCVPGCDHEVHES